jgi:hypothetical protein
MVTHCFPAAQVDGCAFLLERLDGARIILALCGPSDTILASRPSLHEGMDALDGLAVAATLAHELCKTCDYR